MVNNCEYRICIESYDVLDNVCVFGNLLNSQNYPFLWGILRNQGGGNYVIRKGSGFRVWIYALRASDFALRATTGQDDLTSRVLGLGIILIKQVSVFRVND